MLSCSNIFLAVRDEQFKIYIPHLSEENSQEIAFEADPGFMDVDEPTLHFTDPVKVSGEAYIATGELILHLNAATKAVIPCSICNEPVSVDIENKGFYHTVPLNEIKGGNFDFSEAVRENLLLETPDFVECHNGKCSNRENLKEYLKDPDSGSEDEGQRPFANL